ncbi:MAG TPA: hypothetical protein VMT99_03555 [Candidatus Paceibacterota bacterium]|nr:hypothetical protein [Candidatus Paceibacterota bacterium]
MDVVIDKFRETSHELPDLDCFAVADWTAHYRIALTPEEISSLGSFPWSDATLNSPCPFNPGKMIRETHFAFVGVDTITMMELQRLNPQATEPCFYSYAPDAWYSKEKFANKVKLGLRWYLLLKDIVPGSENEMFDEQTAMLPKEYEVPSAVVETAKDLLIFKKTGKYVNPNRCARTSDFDSGGFRVVVGCCDAEGVVVNGLWDDSRNDDVGVGACRKFDEPRS